MGTIYASVEAPLTDAYWGGESFRCAGPIVAETADAVTINWDGELITVPPTAVRSRYRWVPDSVRGPAFQQREVS
jgi:hypothetical protein